MTFGVKGEVCWWIMSFVVLVQRPIIIIIIISIADAFGLVQRRFCNFVMFRCIQQVNNTK